ncbi:MAG TPA: DinB family protein [Pseudonocardiaceae bacterium]|nr:DinB family protein [Pseudonocardiaceae bacterium]
MTDNENRALLAALDRQRHHVLGILDGLADADLRRPVLPSGWSCLGMVRHLAIDVERFWFQAVVAGEHEGVDPDEYAWQVPVDLSAADVLKEYRRETELANMIAAALPLDTAPAWWPSEVFPNLPRYDLRRTILHVITETACHAGHLDAARELIDGRTWRVLT